MKKFITTALATLVACYAGAQTYLPLTGGALTGPLSGTLLTLSGTDDASVITRLSLENFITNNPSSGNGVALDFKLNNYYNSSVTLGKISTINMYYRENTDMAFAVAQANTLSERMRITANGNVGIGTSTPDSKLTVAGNIHAREVKVTVNAGADFVFDNTYKLKPLTDVASYISANKHLPDIASADEMKTHGLELGEMNIKLLQKIEELTLYMIEMKKENDELQKRVKVLEKRR